jgi:hypothetical protein
LRKDFKDVANEGGEKERKNVCLLKKSKFYGQKQRSTGVGHGQKV